MVVSAILLTALAPITGALFGPSYGTSIRIGYEIIFPALFGDMINDQKNKISTSQEEGAKRTIKALHTMFTATGGASAMEFGIEQGIELAKKKTESPDVQSMIDLSLGLTEQQLRKRGSVFANQDKPLTGDEELEQSAQVPGFATPPASQSGEALVWYKQFKKNYRDTPGGNEALYRKWNDDFSRLNTSQRIGLTRLYKERTALGRFEHKTDIQSSIDRSAPIGSLVNQIATKFNAMVISMKAFAKAKIRTQNYQLTKKRVLIHMRTYNVFVAQNRKPKLQVNTAKSLSQRKIVVK